MRINTTHITLSYKRILYIEVAHTSCFTSSSNIFAGKTLVPNSGVLFAHPFMGGKPYYNSSLSLNGSIDLFSISL